VTVIGYPPEELARSIKQKTIVELKYNPQRQGSDSALSDGRGPLNVLGWHPNN
jgi:hypothetical protein